MRWQAFISSAATSRPPMRCFRLGCVTRSKVEHAAGGLLIGFVEPTMDSYDMYSGPMRVGRAKVAVDSKTGDFVYQPAHER